LDQVTQSSRGSLFSLLVAVLFDGCFLVINVFGFDRQADAAILAVNRNDLGFNFVTNFKNVARVFNFLAAQLRGFQYSFNVCSQGHNSSLGFNFFNGTFNDGAFVILGYVLREGIGFQLLDTQGNALALRVDSQHNGFQLVAFLVLAYSFFASFVPGDVG